MIALLLQALKEVALAAGPLDGPRQAWFEAQCSELLERGEALNPQTGRTGTSSWTHDAGTGARGRPKQTKAANLLRRLREHRHDGWRFISDEGGRSPTTWPSRRCACPWVLQKISGCFRTEHGADTFFTIRSYLATMAKQKANLFDCLVSTFNRQPIQPDFAL